MSSLQWHDVPPQIKLGAQRDSSTADCWFGITMGLIGIIAGYVLYNFLH